MLVSVNCMVRDEPLVFFALTSVAEWADEVIVFDTGSTDKTIEDIELAAYTYSNIKFYQKRIPNGHGWSLLKQDQFGATPGCNELGDLRRQMHEMSKGEFVWILDGDEVYPRELAETVRGIATHDMMGADKVCTFLPFVDFTKDFNHYHQVHSMGRLFRKKDTHILDCYPREMHQSKLHKRDLLPQNDDCIYVEPSNGLFVYHYEHILKPWRRSLGDVKQFNGAQPEVFSIYKDLFAKRAHYAMSRNYRV